MVLFSWLRKACAAFFHCSFSLSQLVLSKAVFTETIPAGRAFPLKKLSVYLLLSAHTHADRFGVLHHRTEAHFLVIPQRPDVDHVVGTDGKRPLFVV